MPGVDKSKTVSSTWCEGCKKRLYTSRRMAHMAMKTAHNSVKLYRCPKDKAGWHVTHRSK